MLSFHLENSISVTTMLYLHKALCAKLHSMDKKEISVAELSEATMDFYTIVHETCGVFADVGAVELSEYAIETLLQNSMCKHVTRTITSFMSIVNNIELGASDKPVVVEKFIDAVREKVLLYVNNGIENHDYDYKLLSEDKWRERAKQ